MINIGDYNTLKIIRKADFGYYLDAGTGKTSDDILLPNSSTMGLNLDLGDTVEVFIYRDSEDRLIATLKKPLAKVGELVYLRVVSTTKIGSFIDFGLEKDILVPMKEKIYTLQNDKYYLFYIYLDKTDRIAATTNIDKHLQISNEYKMGDEVTATVYDFQNNKNILVAVDNKYKGIILHNEYFTEIKHGDVIDLRVIRFYEDGRLGLTPRKSARTEIADLQETILEYLREHDGYMPFNDKSSPEMIYKTFKTSKKHFKNSLGGLMKKDLILQNERGTLLK